VARLLLLNGPPGIGKSTLARRWADDRPGTLCLDVDVLHGFLGGSVGRFAEHGEVVRPLALAMVTTHVRERPGRGAAAVPRAHRGGRPLRAGRP